MSDSVSQTEIKEFTMSENLFCRSPSLLSTRAQTRTPIRTRGHVRCSLITLFWYEIRNNTSNWIIQKESICKAFESLETSNRYDYKYIIIAITKTFFVMCLPSNGRSYS